MASIDDFLFHPQDFIPSQLSGCFWQHDHKLAFQLHLRSDWRETNCTPIHVIQNRSMTICRQGELQRGEPGQLLTISLVGDNDKQKNAPSFPALCHFTHDWALPSFPIVLAGLGQCLQPFAELQLLDNFDDISSRYSVTTRSTIGSFIGRTQSSTINKKRKKKREAGNKTMILEGCRFGGSCS